MTADVRQMVLVAGLKSLSILTRQRPRVPIVDATGDSLYTKDYNQ